MDFGTNVLLHLQQPVKSVYSAKEEQKCGAILTLTHT